MASQQLRKRSFDQYSEDASQIVDGGLVDALRRAKEEWQPVTNPGRRSGKAKNKQPSAHQEGANGSKGQASNRPALQLGPQHRLTASVKLSDLQALVLYCLADGVAPQWISVSHHAQVRKAVVLMVPGLEQAMFSESFDWSMKELPAQKADPQDAVHAALPDRSLEPRSNPDDFLPRALSSDALPEPLQPLAKIFPQLWPIKAPGDDKYNKLHSPLHAMLNSPLPKSKASAPGERRAKGPSHVVADKTWKDERMPITELLASRDELLEHNYVLHPAHQAPDESVAYQRLRQDTQTSREHGWQDAQIDDLSDGPVPDAQVEQGSMTAGRSVYSIDCEMCVVEGGDYALTRISIVDWGGDVVMDEYVLPDRPIIDYVTAYSGVSAKSLEGVTTTLNDIQQRLLALFDAHSILIGHSLESDLRALKMTHPFIVDTSLGFPHPRGPPLKSSLKWLVQKYLGRQIQQGHGLTGHDSVEDARACLDLVKQKCERGRQWATIDMALESIFKRLARRPSPSSSNGSASGTSGKAGAIVDRGHPERSFGGLAAAHYIGCSSDTEVIVGVLRAVNGDSDGAEIPGGGVDFVWARLRELEALRGWSNDARFPSNADQSSNDEASVSASPLSEAVRRVSQAIETIYASLPACTLLIVCSGTGDPRPMVRLHEHHRQFKREFATKKWDELSVRWTDVEEQALKGAVRQARAGMSLIAMK